MDYTIDMVVGSVLRSMVGVGYVWYNDSYTTVEELTRDFALVGTYGFRHVGSFWDSVEQCWRCRTEVRLGMYARRECVDALLPFDCRTPDVGLRYSQVLADVESGVRWDMCRIVEAVYGCLTNWRYVNLGGNVSLMQLAGVGVDMDNRSIDYEWKGGLFGNTAMQLVGIGAVFTLVWNGLPRGTVSFDDGLIYVNVD